MEEAATFAPVPAMLDALRSLFRPPFRMLVVVNILVALAGDSIAGPGASVEEGDLAWTLVLLAVSLYVQIAVTLAAGRSDAEPSADAWVKSAWRRRVFWRVVVVSLLSAGALVGGIVLLVVGAFVVGGVIALAQPAAVLERTGPVQAILRSAELTRGVRARTAVVFAVLFLVPTAALWGASVTDTPKAMGAGWVAVPVVVETLGLAGLIACTRIFVVRGGRYDPLPDTTTGENFR